MGSLGFGLLDMFIASIALGAIGGLVLACGSAAKHDAPAPPANDAEPTTNAPASADDPLGLVEGATWTFRGTWTHLDDASGHEITTPITWTTTIASREAQGAATAWRIQGWPGDAPSPQRAAATTTLVVPKAGGIVRFADGAGGAWITLPLRPGDQTCPDPDDHVYCWSVEAADRGVDVILRTRPDVTIYHLEAGRGVTHYEYHHNGTPDDVVLDRVD